MLAECVCDGGGALKECLEMEEEGQGWLQLISSLKRCKGSGNLGEVRENKLGPSNYRMSNLEHLDHLI